MSLYNELKQLEAAISQMPKGKEKEKAKAEFAAIMADVKERIQRLPSFRSFKTTQN